VFLLPMKSGGIKVNIDRPAELLYANLQSQNNIIHSSWKSGVKKLFFIAASCVYPKDCPQPMKEEYLLSGVLEPTSEAYSIAKIAGIKMCRYYNRQYKTNFISVIPATIFGPEDNCNAETSHVIPALINKLRKAKAERKPYVTVWGSGNARREFIYVDDMVDALLFLLKNGKNPDLANIGTGLGISIKELALLIKGAIGFKGGLKFDKTKPEGTMHKLLDVSKMSSMGWKAKTRLKTALHNICARPVA